MTNAIPQLQENNQFSVEVKEEKLSIRSNLMLYRKDDGQSNKMLGGVL